MITPTFFFSQLTPCSSNPDLSVPNCCVVNTVTLQMQISMMFELWLTVIGVCITLAGFFTIIILIVYYRRKGYVTMLEIMSEMEEYEDGYTIVRDKNTTGRSNLGNTGLKFPPWKPTLPPLMYYQRESRSRSIIEHIYDDPVYEENVTVRQVEESCSEVSPSHREASLSCTNGASSQAPLALENEK
ncbi:hypothetical protein Pmani_011479 [Petrolisthes manimaculis]|uniref:Uncharacterized protein n=1 Tax=Petrolisthes manimaculis TaxID=1843537 RepID=A0AAE1UFP2_9EUCA|nr:hypothetical protein Pmani_011479 [Petrolisthes manimaculis]